MIVTKNLKHFPESVLGPLGIEAQSPDDFVSCLFDLSPSEVCASAKACRARLRHPPFTVDEYLALLERQGLVGTVGELRRHVELL